MQLSEGVPEDPDTDHAVLLAPRVWWVGHRLEDDVFQCHSYLIEQGDRSVLIDPGSLLTFSHTLRKIRDILPFESIRYFICHHQDPDIAASLPAIDGMIHREDAVVVTHWRARALLKHYDLKRLSFWLVDENDWKLELEDRTLEFLFTPYAHFPGAFATFDHGSGTLFSSDLFGGFTEKFALFAKDESHFEKIRPFHEHYIPGRDILDYAIANFRRMPVRMIAPQHGSIIPEHLVDFMMTKLSHLDCGIYLFARGDTDIRRLSQLNRTLHEITEVMLLYRDFRDIAGRLLEIVQRTLPVERMEFFATIGGSDPVYLATENNYTPVSLPEEIGLPDILGMDRPGWLQAHGSGGRFAGHHLHSDTFCLQSKGGGGQLLTIPLFSPDQEKATSVAFLHVDSEEPVLPELDQLIAQIVLPLQVALEREMIYRTIERERQKVYERSIRDPLTGLFTRLYMADIAQRQCDIQDRHPESPVCVAMIDIDRFKWVNDTYGHGAGDEVLRAVAIKLKESVRSSDIVVRYGGEEFIIFLMNEGSDSLNQFADRIRSTIERASFKTPDSQPVPVTVSIGTAVRKKGESLEAFIRRADMALYRAKRSGRNRVCCGNDLPSG